MGEAFEDAPRFLVASVDCGDEEAGGSEICSRFDVKGLPGIRYFLPGDPVGLPYSGDRDAVSLIEFAETLRSACVVTRLDGCTDAQREELKEFLSWPMARLRSKVQAFEERLAQHRWEELQARADLDAVMQHAPSSSRTAAQKALTKTMTDAQHSNRDLEAMEGLAHRRAKAVLLFRNPEQYATASGAVAAMPDPSPQEKYTNLKRKKKKRKKATANAAAESQQPDLVVGNKDEL